MSSNYSTGIVSSLPDNVYGTNWLNGSLNKIQLYLLPFIDTSHCNNVYSMNHFYFQFANIFFLLSYFAPNGKYGMIYLRCMLLVGCIFFAFWGLIILCTPDVLIWNSIFIVCNLIHICVLLIQQWPVNFTKELEDLYIEVFKPLKVSKKQFQKLLKCTKTVKYLKYQEIYAQENVTRVEFLSVVLSGKLAISQHGKVLFIVFPHQFLDAPEWFSVPTDDFFQVSITAIEESRVLLWHRDKLKLSIISDKFLQTVIDHILSKDIVNKLMQINEAVTASINGHLLLNDHNDDTFCDNKSLMIVKRSTNGAGITALISKQLQSDNSNELVPLLNRGAYFQHNDQFSELNLEKNNRNSSLSRSIIES